MSKLRENAYRRQQSVTYMIEQFLCTIHCELTNGVDDLETWDGPAASTMCLMRKHVSDAREANDRLRAHINRQLGEES